MKSFDHILLAFVVQRRAKYFYAGALVNQEGEETLLKTGDFALVNPDEMHQYRNRGDGSFMMICGVPKEFE